MILSLKKIKKFLYILYTSTQTKKKPYLHIFQLLSKITFNSYFWLRFDLANAINDYQRLKFYVMCVGNF